MRQEIELGRELFRFASYDEWAKNPHGNYLRLNVDGSDTLAIDADGRVCRTKANFERARDEGTFPVVVFKSD